MAQTRRIPDEAAREAAVYVRGNLKTLRLRSRGDQFDRLFDQRVEVERPRIEIDPAGFDLGEIKNLIYRGKQGVPRSSPR